MGGDVEEHVRVLGGGIFGPMGCREGHGQHDRLVGAILLRLSQERYRVVGYEVGVIVLKQKYTKFNRLERYHYHYL